MDRPVRRRVGLSAVFCVMLLLGAMAPSLAKETPVTPNIVGGGEVSPGTYPFMAALVSASSSDAWAGQFCGGSVVAPGWVMTAGHCVFGSSASSIDVVINRTNLTSSDGERIGAANILIHPQYDNSTLAYDVALIELETVTTAEPIELATAAGSSLWAPGTIATVAGWGFTESRPSFPKVLHEVDVPIISDLDCSNTVNGNELIEDVMLCAGETGKDSCYGDSGGPLFVPDGNGWFVQAGIVSWGYGCADADAPGVYSEVEALSGWVLSAIGDPPPPPPPDDVALLVSLSPDRSGAVPLEGATVDGTIYVFVAPDDGIVSVTFTVDGARPSTDSAAPFDLAGTGRDGSARGYNAGRLSNGSHVVAASIEFADGSTTTITASFSS